MPQTQMTRELASRARSVFKADHPRDIDGHINFFGSGGAPARDMCGEVLLDALIGETPADEEYDEGPSCA
jgi:hypothetical protein